MRARASFNATLVATALLTGSTGIWGKNTPRTAPNAASKQALAKPGARSTAHTAPASSPSTLSGLLLAPDLSIHNSAHQLRLKHTLSTPITAATRPHGTPTAHTPHKSASYNPIDFSWHLAAPGNHPNLAAAPQPTTFLLHPHIQNKPTRTHTQILLLPSFCSSPNSHLSPESETSHLSSESVHSHTQYPMAPAVRECILKSSIDSDVLHPDSLKSSLQLHPVTPQSPLP